MIYKLRHYVSLSNLKLVYYSMFHSHLQYSLLNWGRASKINLHKLEVLQNNILRACFYCSRHFHTTSLYSKFKVLKLKDMFEMELQNLYLNSTITCYHLLITIILPNLITFTDTTQDKKVTNFSTFCWLRKWESDTSSNLPEVVEFYTPRHAPLFFSQI